MAEKPLSAACRDVRPDRVPRDTEHAAPAPMPYLPHITYKKPTGTCYCPAGPYGYCQYGYIGLPATRPGGYRRYVFTDMTPPAPRMPYIDPSFNTDTDSTSFIFI